jgi:hypothetical protein
VGDLAAHDEEAYPDSEGVSRALPGYADASGMVASPAGVAVGGAR